MILAFPVAAFVSAGYSAFLTYVIRRFRLLSQMLVAGSIVALALAALEFYLLLTKGIIVTRADMGRSFTVLHAAVFFLTAPAVANLLVLSRPQNRPRWIAVALVTFIVTISLVFWNIHVSETLYGPDGLGGPYGQRSTL